MSELGLTPESHSKHADSVLLTICACSGLLPSLVGVAHVAIQFPLYEALKSHIAEDGKPLTPLQLVSCAPMPHSPT